MLREIRDFLTAGAGTSRRADPPAPEQRSAGEIPSWIHHLMFGSPAESGVWVDTANAMGVSTVYACVDVLARSVASLPLYVYERTGPRSKRIATEHPLYDILHDAPSEQMTSSDFRRAMQANLSLHGNAYAHILRNRLSEIVELIPLDAPEVEPVRNRVTGEVSYKVRSEVLPSAEVLHLRGTTFDGVFSAGAMSTVRNVIGLAIALDRNASNYFRNNSFPGGFLEHPGTLSTEAANRLQQSFESSTRGENAYRLKVLEEGLKYSPGRSSNTESQFDESRDRQAKEIARVFGVPGHKVGIVSNQPRANVEQENISFVTDTLRPILVTWEQSINHRLLSPEERGRYFVEYSLDGLLRGDLASRYQAYAIARQWGWLSINEIRDLENFDPIGEDGDIYLQPMNMTPAGTPPTDPSPAPATNE